MMDMRTFRYIYIIGILAVALTVLAACGGKGSRTRSDIPDEPVYTHADSMIIITGRQGDFARALALTDSLAEAGALSPVRADNYRGIAYVNLSKMQKSIACFRSASADDNPPAADFWQYIEAGTNLAHIQNGQQDLDGAIRTALHFIHQLEHVESPRRARALQALYLCLGSTQLKLERYGEAAESYDEAFRHIRQTTENDSTGTMLSYVLTTLENIATPLLNARRYDEAERWLNREDSILAVYAEGSEADTNAHIASRIDACRARIALNRAHLCHARGQEAEANRYYADFAASDLGKSDEGRVGAGDYLLSVRRYPEAADCYTVLDRFLKERDVQLDLENIGAELMPKLRANYLAGRKDSALRVAMQIAEVYDSALVQQKRSDAAELATIYDTHGKERQIAEQRAQKRFFVAVSILLAVILLAVIAIAVILFIKHRNERRKNIAIATQISEVMAAKEQLREQRLADTPADEPGDLASLSDERLFAYLRTVIEREELFLDHNCDRQMLTERFSLPKERLGNAFVRGGGYDNVSAFINKLRLDYATQLMIDKPDLDVGQVSSSSGFRSPGYFSTCFRKQFGLSPTAFCEANRSKPKGPVDT